jgi:hypothetical protein
MSASVDTTIDCAWLLADPGTQPAQPQMSLKVSGGRVAAVDALGAVPGRAGWCCRPWPTRTTTPAPFAAPPWAPSASRWKAGCRSWA